MTDRDPPDTPIESLDEHRGMMAQRATESRRRRQEVAADQATLRRRAAAFEEQLTGSPASTWKEAAAKARYLLELFAASPDGRDPRRQALVESVLADFERLDR
jgi:hypothetical protein